MFKLVCDYFASYKENPLLTHELHDAFITTFIRAELLDFNTRLYSAKTGGGRSHKLPAPGFHTEEQYPFNASESVENLILEILTPANGNGRASHYNHKRIKPKRIFMDDNELDRDSSSVPQPMPSQSYSLSRYAAARFTPANPFFYETAFTTEKSPITRVVSKTELKSSFGTLPLRARSGTNLDSRFAYENPMLQLSPSDMINHPKYSRILEAEDLANKGELSSYSFLEYEGSLNQNPQPRHSPTSRSIRTFDGNFGLDEFQGPSRCKSAADLSDGCRDRSPYVPAYGRAAAMSSRGGLAAQYANSPSRTVRKTLDFYYGADACVPGNPDFLFYFDLLAKF